MYTENAVRDMLLCVSAITSNQLARFAPSWYIKLTHQTGRGEADSDPREVANYFLDCFQDYREQFGFNGDEFDEYLAGKAVLEYGPGDILGVALLMYAHGAARITCVDQFPLSNLSTRNIAVYSCILESLDGPKRDRANGAFRQCGDPRSGFDPDVVRYQVTNNGLSGAIGEYDLIVSRAVLEHVNNLAATMLDIKQGLKPDGVSVHQVDLKSHGLDRYVALDFLSWPATAYRWMYGHKGFPNRWRLDRYKALARSSDLQIKKLHPIATLGLNEVKFIHPKLAAEFREISVDELSWLSFWMVLQHPENQDQV